MDNGEIELKTGKSLDKNEEEEHVFESTSQVCIICLTSNRTLDWIKFLSLARIGRFSLQSVTYWDTMSPSHHYNYKCTASVQPVYSQLEALQFLNYPHHLQSKH